MSFKNFSLFQTISNKEEALKVIRDASNAFYLIAIINGVLMIISGQPLGIIDGVIYAVLAFLLRKDQKNIIAIILLVLSALGLITTLLNIFGVTNAGGRNIILASIVVWAAVRAFQATSYLQKHKR